MVQDQEQIQIYLSPLSNTSENDCEAGAQEEDTLSSHVQTSPSPSAEHSLNDIPTCRICFDEGVPTNPIYKRCNCAYYHDHCFNQWLHHRRHTTCEVCGTRFLGIHQNNSRVFIANLQHKACFWLIVYAIILIMMWILNLLVKNYSDCIREKLNQCSSSPLPPCIRAIRPCTPPTCPQLSQCSEWNTIESMFIVICVIFTAIIILKTLITLFYPSWAGLIITRRTSRLLSIPAQREGLMQYPPNTNDSAGSAGSANASINSPRTLSQNDIIHL